MYSCNYLKDYSIYYLSINEILHNNMYLFILILNNKNLIFNNFVKHDKLIQNYCIKLKFVEFPSPIA